MLVADYGDGRRGRGTVFLSIRPFFFFEAFWKRGEIFWHDAVGGFHLNLVTVDDSQ